MGVSKIEWTEQTWNPVTGCTKISAGCKNCYAEVMAKRLQAARVPGYESGFEVKLHPERLDQPLNRKIATMYFVNSMSDLFHPKVPFRFIDSVFKVVSETPQHIYQVLTKRPDRMKRYFNAREVPQNAWLGVSVENQKHGLPRINVLREIKADMLFLSIEPLLEELGEINLSNIHWVIVGGESGSKARPMKPQWVESIQVQCKDQSIPFFFKQWGTWGPDGIRRSKKANGRLLNNRMWNEMPVLSKYKENQLLKFF